MPFQYKSNNGSPASRCSKIEPLTLTSLSSEEQNVQVSDMGRQLNHLQEELKRERDEKSQAMKELKELKKSDIASQTVARQCKSKLQALKKELHRSKESEAAMLEFLAAQNRVYEKTKVSLEETKLENRLLLENRGSLLDSNYSEKHSSGNGSLDVVHHEEEVRMLKREIKYATDAKENIKIAMDGLAFSLKDATTEFITVKEKLAEAQSELESVRAEAEILKSSLKSMEEKFQAASQESERLRLELEESTADWDEKEKGFIASINMSDEELAKLRAENEKLSESQRGAREETAELRKMIKRTVKEGNVAKESMEMARKENARLKDLVSEKELELRKLEHEYECLKVGEAAAIDSVQSLKNLFAATSTMDSITTGDDGAQSVANGEHANDLDHTNAARVDGTERAAEKKKKNRGFHQRIGDIFSFTCCQ
ncbi:hypothetical protein Cni_G00877 [Canna indica]|uniref:Uncharacterized protein n=1 Tax=Canna indica TaxID=4628 RepID=A0AAQ3JNK0_9LILI|nr:hypothetical protein Cni_G00877 [Canna indica]